MADWPTLSREAQREDFEQFPLEDPTIRSISQDGRIYTRSSTRPILYGFSYELRHLAPADKEALEEFQLEVRVGGDSFEWTDVRPTFSGDSAGTVWTVRLAKPIFFDVDDEAFTYRAEIHLEEVSE